MKKISIKKNNLITNQIELLEVEADSWLQYHIGLGTFGRAAYSYDQQNELTPAVYEDQEILDEEGNSFDPAQFESVLIAPATYETVTINVPAEYEVIEEDVTAEVEEQQFIQQNKDLGRAARNTCEDVLDVIGGFNIRRELTFEQKNEMKAIFSNAKSALNDYQPGYAKYFINQITPDGVLVTQQMKDLCIKLLSDY